MEEVSMAAVSTAALAERASLLERLAWAWDWRPRPTLTATAIPTGTTVTPTTTVDAIWYLDGSGHPGVGVSAGSKFATNDN